MDAQESGADIERLRLVAGALALGPKAAPRWGARHRAEYTQRTNRRQPKARRQMAARSRRHNRATRGGQRRRKRG